MARCIIILAAVVFCAYGVAYPENDICRSAMIETSEYIKTIEWDVNFDNNAERYLRYREVYLQKIKSGSPDDIFLSAVMLGLLDIKEATPYLKAVTSDDPEIIIGVKFALCMFEEDRAANIQYLKRTGETTQLAGEANSLKYIEAVELLSLLEYDGFLDYAEKLERMTDEVYQKEAINVAIERYQKNYQHFDKL